MEYELKPPPILPRNIMESTIYPVVTRFYVKSWPGVFRVLQFLHDRRLDYIMTPAESQGWKFEIASYGYDYEELNRDLERVAHGGTQ
jgi:hypothetical protein